MLLPHRRLDPPCSEQPREDGTQFLQALCVALPLLAASQRCAARCRGRVRPGDAAAMRDGPGRLFARLWQPDADLYCLYLYPLPSLRLAHRLTRVCRSSRAPPSRPPPRDATSRAPLPLALDAQRNAPRTAPCTHTPVVCSRCPPARCRRRDAQSMASSARRRCASSWSDSTRQERPPSCTS